MTKEAEILPPPPLPHTQPAVQEHEQLMQYFVGEKKYQAYYQSIFAQLTDRKTMAGFNWGAFVFGVIWLFYRKMYGYGAALMAFLFALGVIENQLQFEAKGVGIGLSVALGMLGNGLYKKFAENKISAVSRQAAAADLQQAVEQAGGTNLGAALALIVFVVVAVFISLLA